MSIEIIEVVVSESLATVEVVTAGPVGTQGIPGTSTTLGGVQYQVLTKQSAADEDVDWSTVDAANTSFTSATGLASTDVAGALDETNNILVEATLPTASLFYFKRIVYVVNDATYICVANTVTPTQDTDCIWVQI